MTKTEYLKKTIVEMEKAAHGFERHVAELEPERYSPAEIGEYVHLAGMYRIAAAACWEKLAREETGDGWYRPNKGQLPPIGKRVIALVCGQPSPEIDLVGSCQMAEYFKTGEREEWRIDKWPEWRTPEVICWQPCPEAPEDIRAFRAFTEGKEEK